MNEPGTDGTVRLVATALNSRKIELDLTTVGAAAADSSERPDEGPLERTVTAPWSTPGVPVIALAGQNHGTIVSDPSAKAVELVLSALDVAGDDAYAAWRAGAAKHSEAVIAAARKRNRLRRWQRLVFHVRDERGDGVEDYFFVEAFGVWAFAG